MRVVFMGSPEFAIPPLRKVIAAGHEIVAVVTQPDKPAGRGRALQPAPAAAFAASQGLPLLKPSSLRTLDITLKLRSLRPDVILVAAFGKILPREVLDIPPLQCVNVHPSLLPRLRGAAPIPYSILEGQAETGVSIMLMEERMDAGPILAQVNAPILPTDTTASLGQRLAELGGDLLVATLPRWARGEIAPRVQDDSQATFTKMIDKAAGQIDWQLPADEIARRCRAFYPWPQCYTHWNGKALKLLQVLPFPDWQGAAAPGQIVILAEMPPLRLLSDAEPSAPASGPSNVAVATGRGALVLFRVQQEGRNPLDINDFVRGQRAFLTAALS